MVRRCRHHRDFCPALRELSLEDGQRQLGSDFGHRALLSVATSAEAECAWVLWVVQGTTVDHLYASYTSAQDCIRELDARERRLHTDRTLFTTRSAATNLNVTDKITAGFSTTYECLPDTVDPRGSKGK